MKLNRNKPMTGLLQVRHFIVSICYQNTGVSVRIPSIRDVAKQLNVAKSSVQLEFERLIADNMLISKRGVGCFTNPHCIPKIECHGKKIPLIGVKLYSGDQFYYDPTLVKTLQALFKELGKMCCNVRMLNMTCSTAEDFRQELKSSFLDGLICIHINKALLPGIPKMLPTVCNGVATNRFDNIYPCFDRIAKEIYHLADQNGVSFKKIHVWDPIMWNACKEQFKTAFGENKIYYEAWNHVDNIKDVLKHYMQTGQFSPVMFLPMSLVDDMQNALHELDISQHILISSVDTIKNTSHEVFYLDYERELTSQMTISMLKERMNNCTVPPCKRYYELELKFNGNSIRLNKKQ